MFVSAFVFFAGEREREKIAVKVCVHGRAREKRGTVWQHVCACLCVYLCFWRMERALARAREHGVRMHLE